MTTIDSYRACLIAFKSNNDYQNSELAIKFDPASPDQLPLSLTYKLAAHRVLLFVFKHDTFSSAKTQKLWLGKQRDRSIFKMNQCAKKYLFYRHRYRAIFRYLQLRFKQISRLNMSTAK